MIQRPLTLHLLLTAASTIQDCEVAISPLGSFTVVLLAVLATTPSTLPQRMVDMLGTTKQI